MPAAGALTARFGCRLVITAASLLLAATLPLLATLANGPLMALTLAAFGAGFGALAVSINVLAVIVEKQAQRPLMSGFHALFSIGGLAGAGAMTALLWAGLPPFPSALCATLLILAVLAAFARDLLPAAGQAGAPIFALPKGPVLAIGALCFIVFLAEGAMLDWSAVLMSALHGVPPARAGLGYAAFAIAMATGRLLGDRIVAAVGGPAILTAGGLAAATGMAVVAVIPSPPAALAGFAMIGLGSSNIVPVLFTAAGRQPVMPAHLAVAAVSTIGFSGILTGPALIGLAAHLTSLSCAFLLVASLLLAVPATARIAR